MEMPKKKKGKNRCRKKKRRERGVEEKESLSFEETIFLIERLRWGRPGTTSK